MNHVAVGIVANVLQTMADAEYGKLALSCTELTALMTVDVPEESAKFEVAAPGLIIWVKSLCRKSAQSFVISIPSWLATDGQTLGLDMYYGILMDSISIAW